MHRIAENIRKHLPTLILGVVITLLALLFNYVIYDRRLPAMVIGNRLFDLEEQHRARTPALAVPFRIVAGLVNLSDDLIADGMYYLRGPGEFPSTRNEIAVIAIDEDSVMRRSWPWPRRQVAELVEKVSDARVVGLDIMFTDPDRTSLGSYVRRFDSLYRTPLDTDAIDPELLDNDLLLARKLSGARAVLGSVLYSGTAPVHRPSGLLNNYTLEVTSPGGEAIPFEDVLLKSGASLVANTPVLRESDPPPLGEGFINLLPPPRGDVRAVPMFAHLPGSAFHPATGVPDHLYPSFALEVLRTALGGTGYRLMLRGSVVYIPFFRDENSDGSRWPVQSVSILDGEDGSRTLMEIPLNEVGEMEINFRSHLRDFTVYPAWEVLEGKHDGAFRNKLVLIGGTVQGVGVSVTSGITDPNVSLVEAHAAMLSAMLKGDFMDGGYQDDYAWQQTTILASGLAVTAALIFGNLVFGVVISALTMVVIFVTNYFFFFRKGMDVGITLPLLSTFTVMASLLVSNYLVVGRERRFIRKAFSLNVSPSILGYLESHPDLLSSLQGENRRMTVLFSDIRGFTTISERMTAPDLARFMNEYLTPMSDIVMRNMGTVDKFIGDGMMAFWNAPADNPHHSRDAARAALDMLDKLDELQSGWTNRGLPQVSIGCGINTGLMFAGYMGSEQRKNYTVMGDNVNIASRLENLNKVYSSSILITESTRDELGGDFHCRVVDKVRVSGKESAVVIYELLGDGPPSDELNEELAAFARVFELYHMREFAAAESLLKELVFIRPAPLYKMYLDRLAIYKALPPPPDWDGTFSMTHK